MGDPWTDAMRRGDFPAAWAIAAASLAHRDPATRDDPRLPYHLRWVWDGRPFDGRDVLVRCYHGLGDTLMFSRFLPLLRARAARVTVEMQPHLLPLFGDFPGTLRLVPFDVAHPLPPQDCDLEIMELSLALRATPADAPMPTLNIAPAPLPPGTVSLCWGAGDWDAGRSVPQAMFAPFCRGPALSLMPGPTTLPVLNPEGCPLDIVRTAQLVAGSALVITVDTMIAHLAGILGRPVWLLVKHDPDWRWPVDSPRTPWYPTMRVWHQSAPGDWAGLVGRAAAELDRLPRLQPAEGG
ncbi:hypothetical protein [Paracoccus sp. SSK6]|uniref:hypothetical protein n=1 Tax=Paracoccus sp. SSK6 TaxID=3143131 RepID=UPI00321BACC4